MARLSDNAYAVLHSKLSNSNIPTLDGIRAIAVFLVIFYHLGMERHFAILPGPLGVLSFFVLSGFLITWLLIKEDEKYGSVSLRGFYRRRALRIFPAFYAFWAVSIVSRYARGGHVPWAQAWSSFFYVSNYHHALFRPQPEYMMHTWSLAVEEQFYLLWPLFFKAFARRRKSLIAGLVVVIGLVWLHRVHIWIAVRADSYIRYAFDTRIDCILVGCLLALVLKENIGKRLLTWLCSPMWAPLGTLGLIICSVLAEQHHSAIARAYKATTSYTVEAVCVAILICQFVVQSESLAWRWLNFRVTAFLGRISYPLYLYHGIAVTIATRAMGSSNILCVVSSVAVAVLIASGSYHLIERRFLALKHRTQPSHAEAPPLHQRRLPAS